MKDPNSKIDLLITEDQTSIRYFVESKFPTIPPNTNDLYVITTVGDRLDLLSQQFYNSTEYYWIITIANPNKLNPGSLFVPSGIQLRIPTNLSLILDRFDSLNNY